FLPPYPSNSSTDFPRSLATSSAVLRFSNPLIVARIILTGLLDQSDFVKMSPTPASSSTARTGPPEITPVPSAAGFINTLPEPKRPLISCRIVIPTIVTSTNPFFPQSILFFTSSVISSSFPMPKSILPFLSPTTTTAAKRKLRPPFTTLATRLMVTTRSSNSVLFVSLFLANVTFPSFYIKIQVQIHELLLLMLSHVHGIHI